MWPWVLDHFWWLPFEFLSYTATESLFQSIMIIQLHTKEWDHSFLCLRLLTSSFGYPHLDYWNTSENNFSNSLFLPTQTKNWSKFINYFWSFLFNLLSAFLNLSVEVLLFDDDIIVEAIYWIFVGEWWYWESLIHYYV